MDFDRKICCCFTGHRPEKLTMTESEVCSRLEQEIQSAVSDGFTVFISGMAEGVDLWAAQIVLRLKSSGGPAKLVCAFPYNGFNKKSALCKDIAHSADEVIYVYEKYNRSCFQKRNEWMVDHSSRVIAVYNGAAGGTKNTVDYAIKQGVKCIEIS